MCELNTLEEHRIRIIGVLFCVNNVSANRSDPGGYGSDNALAIRARNEQDGGGIQSGGDDGNRTHDLLLAKQALYQLSYVPEGRKRLSADHADHHKGP